MRNLLSCLALGVGAALRPLGERESRTARLEEAVAAFRAALEEFTRERVPLQWAATQSNVGNVLAALGRGESGTARLEEAVSAYRAALEERTRERVPLDWAASFGNQGVALTVLADRKDDALIAETAVKQIKTAYEATYSGGHEQWAAYNAQAIFDRLKKR
ncbi:hypothetical protein [Roseiarcus sp.]|uniref:hypothetical protein n=1 Tax=Roseiarcus sp. TaxID=1969460 RepID=UPI003F9AF804